MDFKQKIDTILDLKNIKLWKLADDSGLGTTLEKAYTENREMRTSTTKKFLQKVGINEEWWNTQKGEILSTQKKEDDILDHPLVKSFVDQINLQKKMIEILEQENARLRGGK